MRKLSITVHVFAAILLYSSVVNCAFVHTFSLYRDNSRRKKIKTLEKYFITGINVRQSLNTNYVINIGNDASIDSPIDVSRSSINKRKSRRPKKKMKSYRTPDPSTLKRAEETEAHLICALDSLRATIQKRKMNLFFPSKARNDVKGHTIIGNMSTSNNKKHSEAPLHFPNVRDCNSALAAFGDNRELLRALRTFYKMRIAATAAETFYDQCGISLIVPIPTLVTYSTLMSRAVHVGKPQVSMRLWNLMKTNPHFFSNIQASCDANGNNSTFINSSSVFNRTNIMIPDIKAANTLMNCYAKLADVKSAQDLLSQMKDGNGIDVPYLEPNLVTYNTLIDACHKAGDLDAALATKNKLENQVITIFVKAKKNRTSNRKSKDGNREIKLTNSTSFLLRPDKLTYTSLIGTVARKACNSSGLNDPSMAFSLLNEMISLKIRPNGMTYSALIDVCGRCKRSDLALKGIRIMQKQKAIEQNELRKQTKNSNQQKSETMLSTTKHGKYVLKNEVGAWTAAINACGKAGRVDTAIQLFYAMPNFGVKPNTITCACLMDCLLKHGRTTEILDVLRYMKNNGIVPSEYMYTSLMTSAGKLVELEKQQQNDFEHINAATTNESIHDQDLDPDFPASIQMYEQDKRNQTCAIEVYTELMMSLMEGRSRSQRVKFQSSQKNSSSFSSTSTSNQEKTFNNNVNDSNHNYYDSNILLLKVFLVFQEMKATGAQPDIACYNALLKACSKAADIDRALNVLKQIERDNVIPDDTSWREIIRAACKSQRLDIALTIWEKAVNYHVNQFTQRSSGLVNGSADTTNIIKKEKTDTIGEKQTTSSVIPAVENQKKMMQVSCWKPDVETFIVLVSGFIHYARYQERNLINKNGNTALRKQLYRKVLDMFTSINDCKKNNIDMDDDSLGLHYIEQNELLSNWRIMSLILQAVVSLEELLSWDTSEVEKNKLRQLSVKIVKLSCFTKDNFSLSRLHYTARNSMKKAHQWTDNFVNSSDEQL